MTENIVPEQKNIRWVADHIEPWGVVEEPSNRPTGGLRNRGHIPAVTTPTDHH